MLKISFVRSWVIGQNTEVLEKNFLDFLVPLFGGDVRLKGWFDCTAAGVVYVITCQRCYKLYIGETGRRLSDRFGERLRSVEGFKQNSHYQGGGFPVAEHFNLPEHNHVHDKES